MFKVADPEPLTEAGVKMPLLPVGSPVTVRATEPVNPPVAAIVVVKLAAFPAETVCEAGETLIVKFPVPAALTTRFTVTEWERLPLVPVTVTLYVPTAVLAAVVSVSVEDPAPVTDVGLKLPVTPVGNPLTLKVTALLKPFKAATLAV